LNRVNLSAVLFRQTERLCMWAKSAWTVRTSRVDAALLSIVVLVPTHRSGSSNTTLQPICP